MAFNLTRAAGALTETALARARTATIRRPLSTCPPASPPQPDDSPCTYPGTGPGKQPGKRCSRELSAATPRNWPNTGPPPAHDPKDQQEYADTEIGRPTTPANRFNAHNRSQHRTATESAH